MFQAMLQRSAAGVTQDTFAAAISSDRSMLRTMELQRTLDGHQGCVNTVNFTEDGENLYSGSDDLQIICWNWQTGRQRLKFESGHNSNVFQVKPMPTTSGRTLLSCARDGQVRLHLLSEGGDVQQHRLFRHGAAAHKLAVDSQDEQCCYSCGEDGRVAHIDLRLPPEAAATKLLVAKRRSTTQRSGLRPLQLYAIHCNPARPSQFAVCGCDQFVRVFDSRMLYPGHTDAVPITQLVPEHLQNNRDVHCTCIQFSREGELLATYNDENVYLFSRNATAVAPARDPLDPSPPSSPWTGPSRGSPKRRAERSRQRTDAREPKKQKGGLQLGDATRLQRGDLPAVEMISEYPPRRKGKPQRAAENDYLSGVPLPATSSDDDEDEPEEGSDHVLRQFKGHRNCRTVKGVSFFGQRDEYVMSGSDDGHIYIWDKGDGSLQAWLAGDRDVVNCLEPHPILPFTLATSGIDDDVKIWQPTAGEAKRPGPRADWMMQRNVRDQGTDREFVIDPVLLQLLRMHDAFVGLGGEASDEDDEDSDDAEEEELACDPTTGEQ